MKLSIICLALTTLSSLTLAITAPVVKAQKIPPFAASNPPAEVPSPSLYSLDPSSAIPVATRR